MVLYIQDKEGFKMTEKNKKKLEAKKRRNLWTINPKTRFKENDKAYNRQRDKKQKEKFYQENS